MAPKTVSFVLITLSLGFTAFAFSQVPFAEASPEPLHASQAPYRHYAARARNGSTQKSVGQALGTDGGMPLWDPIGTGNHGTGLDNAFDGGTSGAGTGGDQSSTPHR
jgi:hypothetical protein